MSVLIGIIIFVAGMIAGASLLIVIGMLKVIIDNKNFLNKNN
jgi:hypothetical protein